ncbi:hypothetical protein HRU45_00880 [Candidatus Dependentiae bacterium]|nr:hypothetical protein [Candidatus Dependentiae bacterium]
MKKLFLALVLCLSSSAMLASVIFINAAVTVAGEEIQRAQIAMTDDQDTATLTLGCDECTVNIETVRVDDEHVEFRVSCSGHKAFEPRVAVFGENVVFKCTETDSSVLLVATK